LLTKLHTTLVSEKAMIPPEKCSDGGWGEDERDRKHVVSSIRDHQEKE